MKKRSYKGPIILLIAAVGAYHVSMLVKRPRMPQVEKTEVIWGEMSDMSPETLPGPPVDAGLCAEAKQAHDDNKAQASVIAASRVRFEYRPVASSFVNRGDSVQIMMAQGSHLTIGTRSYPLQQIQFGKSETSDQYQLYLIHQVKDGNAAVVAVPLQVSEEENPAIGALWRYLPKHQGDHNSLDDLHVDINNLLPNDRSYVRYPDDHACSEHLVLLGLLSPVKISSAQLTQLDKVLSKQSL